MENAQIIAIDWGSSNFRAYLLDAQGKILEQLFAHEGILHIEKQQFAKTLSTHCHTWLDTYPDLPIIMCGMIGSRSGWHEVPYVRCPADAQAIAKQLYHFTFQQRDAYIVPGVELSSTQHYDVMRGEETQLIGLLHEHTEQKLTICLPGTHSKWATINNNQLMRFQTFMSGELFKLLSSHSILGKLMSDGYFDESAFLKGVLKAKQSNGLLADLFSVRSLGLNNTLSGKQLKHYMAGIIIGYEVKDAIKLFPGNTVTVIANHNLAKNYIRALQQFNILCHAPDSEKTTTTGLYLLAKLAGIL